MMLAAVREEARALDAQAADRDRADPTARREVAARSAVPAFAQRGWSRSWRGPKGVSIAAASGTAHLLP